MEFTESVRVLPRAGDALHLGLAAELAFRAHLAGDARHFRGEGAELVHHRVDGVLELEDLALHVDGDLLRQVAAGNGGGHLGDVAHLGREVAGHGVHAVGQVLPRAGDTLHVGLAAELAFGADLAGHARHFRREGSELVHHRVDGVFQLEDFALHVDGDLARQVAVGDGGRHVGDVAHLGGEVAGHRVHAVGQVLPRAGDALHLGLAAELAFRAHLAGDARHFRGERAELIHHRVDGVLELEDLALHVDRDLLRQVAAGDGGGHLGDVAHLGREVAGHGVDALGQVLPRAGDALHVGLAAECAFGADLAGDARHLGGERAELVHHRVDGVLQLEQLALDVHGDLLRQVAHGNGGRHVGDVAHLTGEVLRHRVDAVGQVLPGAGDALHLGLAAELAFRAHLARDARHLDGEGAELLHHGVDGLCSAQEFAFEGPALDLERHALGKVALRDRADDARNLARGMHEVFHERVHGFDVLAPEAAHVAQVCPLLELAFLADHAAQARKLGLRPDVELDHVVEGLRDLAGDAGPRDGELGAAVALLDGEESVEEHRGLAVPGIGADAPSVLAVAVRGLLRSLIGRLASARHAVEGFRDLGVEAGPTVG